MSVFRKGHLFDVELTSRGVSLKESAFTIPGPSLVPPVQTPVGKVRDTRLDSLQEPQSAFVVCVGLIRVSTGCTGGPGDLL